MFLFCRSELTIKHVIIVYAHHCLRWKLTVEMWTEWAREILLRMRALSYKSQGQNKSRLSDIRAFFGSLSVRAAETRNQSLSCFQRKSTSSLVPHSSFLMACPHPGTFMYVYVPQDNVCLHFRRWLVPVAETRCFVHRHGNTYFAHLCSRWQHLSLHACVTAFIIAPHFLCYSFLLPSCFGHWLD